MITSVAMIVIGYFAGSVSSAILYARATRQADPRLVGSGNPGATNILRTQGKKAAAIVLIGDIAKGVIPILIGRLLHLSPFVLSLVALAAIVGHLFPIYFGFKGGKGVATALGVVFALSPSLGGCCILTWAIVAAVFRYSSLASLIMAVCLPMYTYWLQQAAFLPSMLLVTALIILRHRRNIHNLMLGKESKLGSKTKQKEAP